MAIFDSHCHPQFPQYDADQDEMIKRNLEQGIFMIAVGANLETSKQAIELAQKHENIWATVGQHPTDVESGSMNQESWAELLKQPKVVAVGEVGLDYYRTPEPEKQKQQREVFLEFVNLAKENDLPLVLHVRNEKNGKSAQDDMVELLSSNMCGVTHSFTGTLDEAKKYLNLGFYLGFNGIITFPPSPSEALREGGAGMYDELVKYVPLDRILLETDAPYLTPEPYRGQRNEPAHVIEVAKKLAELKNESLEWVIEQTTANCRHLFRI